jgi:excisionase family DNA binding protein
MSTEMAQLPTGAGHRLLRVREVAEVMRVSTMTVYRLIQAGELVATRVGRSYRIWQHDVDTYLSRGDL